jgi:beta-xylosidase
MSEPSESERVNNKVSKVKELLRSFYPMDYIDKILDKLKDIAQKLIEILLGPQVEPEREMIPIPVDDRQRR